MAQLTGHFRLPEIGFCRAEAVGPVEAAEVFFVVFGHGGVG
jgi:hypothetical protein